MNEYNGGGHRPYNNGQTPYITQDQPYVNREQPYVNRESYEQGYYDHQGVTNEYSYQPNAKKVRRGRRY